MMIYEDVVKNGLILPRKEKYTMRDFHKLRGKFDARTARFIIVCSASYWRKKQEAAGEEPTVTYSMIFEDLKKFQKMDQTEV